MRLLNATAFAALIFLGTLLPGVPAQTPAIVTNAGPATVTAAMGDVGGKLFGRSPAPEKTRHYYIAAEPQLWDFAPENSDPVCGKPLPPPVVAKRASAKVRYVEYTDATFTARVRENPRLGILGPVLRGVVGENIAVTFWNRADVPLSMHPHGVKYDKDSEGSYYQPGPGLGAAVAPNAKFTYVWQLDENSGPAPGEPSSKAWLYHSHVSGDEEANLGLIGFVIVADPKRARPDGTPADVDREEAALFMIFDESGLGADEKEAAEYAGFPGLGPPPKTWTQVQELTEQGGRYAINGRIFGNLPGLEMNEGERVRWYLFALGSEQDFHTAHWHGLRVVEEGHRRTDVVELLPATMKVADMVADNPGSWLFHCHVAEHMMEGMFARVTVHSKAAGAGRAPEPAFFGLASAQQSLQIQRAIATASAASCEIKLVGSVTVSEAFSVFTDAMQIHLGSTSAAFQPNRRGVAEFAGGKFRVENSGEYGVVYGGQMNFEAQLSSSDWLRELRRAGLKTDVAGPQKISVPIILEIGGAKHRATVPMAVTVSVLK